MPHATAVAAAAAAAATLHFRSATATVFAGRGPRACAYMKYDAHSRHNTHINSFARKFRLHFCNKSYALSPHTTATTTPCADMQRATRASAFPRARMPHRTMGTPRVSLGCLGDTLRNILWPIGNNSHAGRTHARSMDEKAHRETKATKFYRLCRSGGGGGGEGVSFR